VPAKKANTMKMKCLSLSLNCICQSDSKSADKSISSAVQKEATCCLHMFQRSGCSMGKRENRDPLSSVLQMGSTVIMRDFGPRHGNLHEIGTNNFGALCGTKRNLTLNLKKSCHKLKR
jgi:hypothetical protein